MLVAKGRRIRKSQAETSATILRHMNRRKFIATAAAATTYAAFLGERGFAALSRSSAPGLCYYYPVPPANPPRLIEADVCVYSATSGGVTAAVQASRMGKKAVLIEFGRHVGGMTASGLSDTDGGENSVTGGITAEFYNRVLADKYGKRALHPFQPATNPEKSGFRPTVAETVFREMLQEANVPVFFEHRLKSVAKNGNLVTEITIENGNRVRAKQFIDASYEGDLMAMAGVSHVIGREGNAKYHETLNGVIFGPKDNFEKPLDPYVIPGKPESGLLPLISPDPPGEVGSGDKCVPAYNFRMWLVPAAEALPWPKPARYDPNLYALLLRYIQAGNHYVFPHWGDNNNQHFFDGAFSTDFVGANRDWPDGDYQVRERIFQKHVTYQQGLMYFLANDQQVPGDIRAKIRAYGLPKNEFIETGGWPHQIYVREARRMVSDYVATQHDGEDSKPVPDGIALATYLMDSHNTRRLVVNCKVSNEGQMYIKIRRPMPISYRAIVPHEGECGNLSVLFCNSASHVAIGTVRQEPPLMVTGQSAATAACLAIDAESTVQQVDYSKLSKCLLADGQILTPPPGSSWQGVITHT